MRVVVIGGSGHIGTYLVPRLVAAEHEVISISRGEREPYQTHSAWRSTQRIKIDREKQEESGNFGQQIGELKPDVVIDLICFRLESTKRLVDALRGKIQ